jgi:RNA polymerase sigma factor (sigma-70 family)
MTGEPPTSEELQAIAAAARRIARGRGADEDTADDIAQETISRLLAADERLEPAARLPYALTTAGNLVVSMARASDRARRHQPRLADFSQPANPEETALALEAAAAVRAALQALDPQDRLLFLHHAEGVTTVELAAAGNSTPAAIAARLARTRARLRLDYLLAFRRIELPTARCRQVLLAVSASDQRRQQALGTAAHLGECPTCVSLIPPLVQRSSTLTGIAAAPLIAAGGWGGRVSRAFRSHWVQAAAGVGAVAVAAGIYGAVSGRERTRSLALPSTPVATRPVATPSPSVDGSVRTAAGITLMPVPGPATLKAVVGQRIVIRDMPVQSVVSHPGFWIGTAGDQRLYVHLDNADAARARIVVGRDVTFVAVLTANPAGFAASDGVAPSEGAALLTAQAVHLSVEATKVVQER